MSNETESNGQPYQCVSINDNDFATKALRHYQNDGVLVITDVFSEEESNQAMSSILDNFEALGSDIDRNDPETWNVSNLPPQSQSGLFQYLVSNFQPVWDIRSNAKVKKIFKTLYSGLRQREINDFIVSNDGINIRPNGIGPYHEEDKDWPHLDTTLRNNRFLCIQGQAVLTNTTAALVASPKSHLIYEDLLKLAEVEEDDTSQWCPLIGFQEEIKEMIKSSGGTYQVPIYAPKGSFIVWSSSCVHSNKYPDKKLEPDESDFWKGWRGVVYVCYRPKEEFTKEELEFRHEVIEYNRVTNHWSTGLFPQVMPEEEDDFYSRSPIIQEMLCDPVLVYEQVGKPVLNEEQLKLIGL